MSDLAAWVDKLGAMSSQEIRTLLRDEGIKGFAQLSARCPLANFLVAKCGGTIYVGHHTIGRYSGVTSETIDTPNTVSEFVGNVDYYAYPELIK
jgi:hypothetical protein